MSVTSVDKNFDDLSLTLTADFSAPVERVWRLWADPRQLERWWGPPTYPATVEEHDLTPGGKVTYHMTGPDGEKHRGWWEIVSVNPPTALEFVDGFSDADGAPSTDMPTTHGSVEISAHGDGTRMVVRSTFRSREHMEQLMEMGMDEGMEGAMGQIDALLAV
ncbi:SRPBCC domain-containing protein [Nocardiopsis sp. N85]|uniref:SRPBCC family protein n=1 Tax=Nocardiopsis sp. N85 TaxID=3029400 RepID=UPI00237F32FF|nr:SRPBCC domain-containing protein [Nocardiopsis sp. N85]MDE3721088.1 SRPBCC domain-containing protein [Nocardiopsis sp. N85]